MVCEIQALSCNLSVTIIKLVETYNDCQHPVHSSVMSMGNSMLYTHSNVYICSYLNNSKCIYFMIPCNYAVLAAWWCHKTNS